MEAAGIEPSKDFAATGKLPCGCVICEECRAALALQNGAINGSNWHSMTPICNALSNRGAACRWRLGRQLWHSQELGLASAVQLQSHFGATRSVGLIGQSHRHTTEASLSAWTRGLQNHGARVS